MMTPEKYQHVQQIFLRVRDVPLSDRDAELERLDEETRVEVLSLLEAEQRCGDFLESDGRFANTLIQPGPVEGREQIGPYRLLQQIGEGGFGAVYMAEQTTPVHRKVAIKLIKPGMDSKQVLARFQAERQALAMMDHPSIASFFDVGTTENGAPYFVMELVRGVPIDEYCKQNALSLHQRLGLFLQVCSAVHHAHRKGVIHRDLKPTNVLVGMGEPDPIAKVIDFGIAKALDARLTDATLFTEFGQMVGTLEFMSPEQAEMSVVDIDTRSDIYSLGVMLYKLLTGTTPISREVLLKDGIFELPRVMRETEPVKPSTKVTTFRNSPSKSDFGLSDLRQGDLDWITMKCLAKDRRDRYDTANELANDVRQYLAGLPVSAHPPSFVYRSSKFIRRNRVAAAMAFAVLIGSLLGVAGLVAGLRNAHRARDQAEENLRLADEAQQQTDQAKRKLEETIYAELVNSAWRASKANRTDRAKQLLTKAAPRLRGWEWRFVDSRIQDSQRGLLRKPGLASVNRIDADPTGSLMVCTLANGKAEVRSLSRDDLVRELPTTSRVTATAFTADTLLVGMANGRVASFNVRDWRQMHEVDLGSGGIYDIAVNRQENQYAVCTGARWVGLFNADTHTCTNEWKPSVRLSRLLLRDGKLVGAGLDGNLYLMTPGDEDVETRFVSRSSLNGIGWIGEDTVLAAAGADAIAIDLASADAAPQSLSQQQSIVSCVATNSRTAIVGRGDGAVLKIQDSATTLFLDFDVSATAAHWDQAGGQFILGLSDGRVLALEPFDEQASVAATEAGLTTIALLSSGFVTASNAGWLTGRHFSDEHPYFSDQLHEAGIWNMSFDAEERLLTTVGEDFSIRGWSFPSGKPRFEKPIAWGVRDVCVAPEGKWIAGPPPADSGFPEGTISIWNARGECVRSLEGHANWVLRFAVSPDGRYLVSGSEDRTTRVWNTRTWKCEYVLSPELRSPAELFAFPSATELAIGHRDGRVTFWDLETGDQDGTWEAFGDALSSLSATPDKRLLATSRSSTNLKVYSCERSEIVASLPLDVGYISHFAVSRDGGTVAYGDNERMRPVKLTPRKRVE